MSEPLEVSTRYTMVVESMPNAFAFIMKYMDAPDIGESPSIHLHPVWWRDDDGETTRRFEVVIEGTIERIENDEALVMKENFNGD